MDVTNEPATNTDSAQSQNEAEHTTDSVSLSRRGAARFAGVGYLFLFALGIFANFTVLEGLVVPGNASATAANIVASENLFRAGLYGFLVIFLLDVALAWLLFVLFRTVNRDIALVAAWFRLVYTVFLGVAMIFLFGVLQLLSGAEYLSVFEPGQINAHITLLLEAFNYTWMIGLAAFGIHLMIIGRLLFVSNFKLMGLLLGVAGAAYLIDTSALTLLDSYAEYSNVFLLIVAIPAIIGEFAFTSWLLFWGGKKQKTNVGSSFHAATKTSLAIR